MALEDDEKENSKGLWIPLPLFPIVSQDNRKCWCWSCLGLFPATMLLKN